MVEFIEFKREMKLMVRPDLEEKDYYNYYKTKRMNVVRR